MHSSLAVQSKYLQYEYNTFNHYKQIQTIKDIANCKEIKEYDKKSITEICQANIQQIYFMFISIKNKLKIYKEKDLFLTTQGKIVFFTFNNFSHQKLAKIQQQVNSKNLFQLLKELIQKMHFKFKKSEVQRLPQFYQMKNDLEDYRMQLYDPEILNSQVIKILSYSKFFQKYSLKARIQVSLLINKFKYLQTVDFNFIKSQFTEFKQILNGCYTSISVKENQKNKKLECLLLHLSKCEFFDVLRENQLDKISQPQSKQMKQIHQFKYKIIIQLQISNSQSEKIKQSLSILQKKAENQFMQESNHLEFSQTEKKLCEIFFIDINTIQIKLETGRKINKVLFEAELKKIIKDIIQNLNSMLLDNSQVKIKELLELDMYIHQNTQMVYLKGKIKAQKNQLNILNVLKAIDKLVVLHLALVKIFLYYQILSFDIPESYSLSEPTKAQQINLIRNIHGFWGILFQEYESLDQSFLQQSLKKG